MEVVNSPNLARPIPVYNVDGTLNEAGAIRGIVDIVLRYKGHTECAQFAVTGLGKQDLIFGYIWLHEHNPEVDWQTNMVKMSCCPAKCHTCTKEVKAENQENQQEACHAQACCTGPIPSVDDDLHDITDLVLDLDDTDCDSDNLGPGSREPNTPAATDDKLIEEGDWIFATCFHNEPAEVCATQNISQWLAEAFHKNSETKSFRDLALDYLYDLEDVFSKTSFNELLARKPWDHAIELILDAQNKSCKVYPQSISEQEQLDKFLKENLTSGWIRPSKSPMAAPFFFVKKKDGLLHLVSSTVWHPWWYSTVSSRVSALRALLFGQMFLQSLPGMQTTSTAEPHFWLRTKVPGQYTGLLFLLSYMTMPNVPWMSHW
jgi:hypothetical protein